MVDILLTLAFIAVEAVLLNRLARWMAWRNMALPLREPNCRLVYLGDPDKGEYPIFDSKDGSVRWSAENVGEHD